MKGAMGFNRTGKAVPNVPLLADSLGIRVQTTSVIASTSNDSASTLYADAEQTVLDFAVSATTSKSLAY